MKQSILTTGLSLSLILSIGVAGKTQANDLSNLIKGVSNQGKSILKQQLNKHIGGTPAGALLNGQGSSGAPTQAYSATPSNPDPAGYSPEAGTAWNQGNATGTQAMDSQPGGDTQSTHAGLASPAFVMDGPGAGAISGSAAMPAGYTQQAHGPVINGFGSAKPGHHPSHHQSAYPSTHSNQGHSNPAQSNPAQDYSAQASQVQPSVEGGYPVPPEAGIKMYKRSNEPIPRTFPLPSVPGSKASMYRSVGNHNELSLLTKDPVSKVFDFYIAHAQSQGWKPVGAIQTEGNNRTQTFWDQRNKEVHLSFMHFDGWTEITLAVQQ